MTKWWEAGDRQWKSHKDYKRIFEESLKRVTRSDEIDFGLSAKSPTTSNFRDINYFGTIPRKSHPTPILINRSIKAEGKLKIVYIYAYGQYGEDFGLGKFAVVLKYRSHSKMKFGVYRGTTDHRIELISVITGLECIKEPCFIKVFTNSKYIIGSISQKIKDFGNKDENLNSNTLYENDNQDLWNKLIRICKLHLIEFLPEWENNDPEKDVCRYVTSNQYKSSALVTYNDRIL